MSESEQTAAVDEQGANRQASGVNTADGQDTSDQNPTTSDKRRVPASQYGDAREAVDKRAAAGFEGYVSVLDELTRYAPMNVELALFEHSLPDAQGAALRQAKAFYDRYRRPCCRDVNVRVFTLHNGKVRRTAYFMLSHEYRDEDFEHEHVDEDWTYTLDLGPENPKCTIRFDRRFRGISEPLGGWLSADQLNFRFNASIDVSGQLSPPESCNCPTFNFDGPIKLCQAVHAFGSHDDPRYRVIRYLDVHEWDWWRFGPMFDDGTRRKSLRSEIRKHWPEFDDNSILFKLADHFRESVSEWVRRNMYDRTLGIYAPTLHRRQFKNRCRGRN